MSEHRAKPADWSQPAVWVIQITVLLQCIGLFRIAHIDGTTIGETVFMTLLRPERDMLLVDIGAAWLGLLSAASLVVRPTRVPAAFVTVWFFLVAILTFYQGGQFGYELAVFSHATRYVAPAALFLIVSVADGARIARLVMWACALTFAAHGIEALRCNPHFIDFVITAFGRVDISISEPATRILLRAIGIQDLVLAVLLVTRRWRWVAAYMAFWGAVTAGSRVVHMGWVKWAATLVRAANAGLPLALWFWWSPRRHGGDGPAG